MNEPETSVCPHGKPLTNSCSTCVADQAVKDIENIFRGGRVSDATLSFMVDGLPNLGSYAVLTINGQWLRIPAHRTALHKVTEESLDRPNFRFGGLTP
jgi:hypothetical protein